MRIWVLTALIAAFALAPGAAAQPATGLTLVDLTDDFARIYDRDAALPDAERIARFKSDFSKILPGFYSEKRIGVSAEKYDYYLLLAIKDYPPKRAGIDRVAREFSAMLAPAQASFERAFGPMTGYPPVYLVNALGEFDGGTRKLPEGTRLLFGADVIDRLYKDSPVQPFVHHELFHLRHNRDFEECEPIWCSLWSEGLAVYVAAQLNPGADDHALLLDSPVPLRPAVERNRREAVCTILAKLDSEAVEDYRPIFMGGSSAEGSLPRRYGYYVGYLVAADLGRTRSLQQLATLKPAEVRPLVRQSLAAMEDCPRAGGERG